ncbi:diguanylate cyclase (GGDEF) domain-containing protein [Kaistia soli DSM 19436]|uniref:diguanylate cyclase n=1 Tax=Kaistia soli DSM 19436 TaxID=1122133 RepID=A0A1M5H165_9HYPH|nr:GGDEF domain-containing protein [Kaistia soli]SHG09698.1 diguanylate cyclase (GGDEF) domain-containing protein [Kaistia soli DSM 19436]
MSLDPTTLLFVLAGVSLISGAALGTRWLRSRHEGHVLYWGVACVLGGAGVVGLAFRGLIPNFLSIQIANALILAALGLALSGVRVFTGHPPWRLAIVIAPAIWLLACLVPAVLQSEPYRVAVASMLSGGLSALLGREVWRRGSDQLSARKPMAVLCFLHAGFTLVRALFALWIGIHGALSLDRLFVGVGLLEPLVVLFGILICGLGLTQERRELVLTRKAALDALTGLLNRGAFLEEAEAMVEAARLAGNNIALLTFDIDFFKDINDTFGHAVGDRTLVAFADAARHVLRPSDPVGRLGGEEFAALIVGADREGAALLAEQVRAEFARRTALLDGIKVAATACAGISASRGARAPLETMMIRADEALYAAKRGGRDLVWQAAE